MSTFPKMRRPAIGITVGEQTNIITLFCLKTAIRLAGGQPRILRPRDGLLPVGHLQGLVISGGNDIDPALYGEENTHSVNIDQARDKTERAYIQAAFDHKLPILGICRGGQLINVTMGGSLHQDAPSAFEGFLVTDTLLAKALARRKISIADKSRLSAITRRTPILNVNSIHHQAHKSIAPCLRVVAADRFGLPQAIEGIDERHFVLGVQWHPEYMLYSRPHFNIFRALITASRGQMPRERDMMNGSGVGARAA